MQSEMFVEKFRKFADSVLQTSTIYDAESTRCKSCGRKYIQKKDTWEERALISGSKHESRPATSVCENCKADYGHDEILRIYLESGQEILNSVGSSTAEESILVDPDIGTHKVLKDDSETTKLSYEMKELKMLLHFQTHGWKHAKS